MPANKNHCVLLAAVFFSALLFISGAMPAAAQGFGTIVGTVTDPSGAVVPAATVKLTNEGTKLTREVKANEQGYYVIPSLEPAVYTVAITAPGFQTFQNAHVTLLADQSLTVNGALHVGAETETVTVETNPVQVNTSTSSLSQVVEQKRIVDLPLNGRNPVSLTLLTPGAVQGSSNSIDQGVTKTFPAAITVSFNGSRSNQTGYNLDGSSNTDTYTNVNMPFPFPDALQEFSVQSSNYSARYGGNAGAVVNAITKSGTNGLHGDVFEFVRNAVFNARNYFATARDQLKRNQFGGTLGGPVVFPHLYNGKDRTFFFFGYQGTQIRNIQNGNIAYIPTPAELNGDFSALLTASNPANPLGKAYQLYDPTTNPTTSASARKPFSGNFISPSRFDPAAVAFTKYLPIASADQTGRINFGIPLKQTFNEYIARVDHAFTPKDRLTARYYINKFNNGQFLDQANYLNEVSPTLTYAHNAILSESHVFSANALNDVRLSFSRITSNTQAPDNSISYNTLGLNIWQPPTKPYLGTIGVSGYFNTTGTNLDLRIYRDNYNFSDDLTITHGRHSFVFGGAFVRGQVLLRDSFQAAGNFTFTADNTGNTSANTGNALASFLLGSIRTFIQGAGEFKDNIDYVASLFAQDDFHVTSRLTINAGLRWEPFQPYIETKGRVEQFRAENYAAGIRSTKFPNAPAGLIFPGDAGMPNNGVNPSWIVFAPRVGFALDVFGDGRTSIRGAFGSFHDSQQAGIANNRFVDVTPFSPQVTVTTPAGPFINPYCNGCASGSIVNPFPAPPVPPANTQFVAPVLVVTYNPANNSKLPVPTTYNFNLSVQHQFKGGWLFNSSYVGGLARHVYEGVERNPAVYTPGSTAGTDARRAFVGYGSIAQVTDDAVSSYNALQVTAQRRMNSLTVLANYTYSKSLDDIPYNQTNTNASASSNSPLPYGNPFRHQYDYGPSDFDRRHVGSLSYVYDFPRLAHQNFAVRTFAGGWRMTGILRAQTGTPFTVLAGSDRAQTGLNTDRAQIVAGVPLYSRTGCTTTSACVPYLNQAAYSLPATGTSGNMGKDSLVGPNALTWDVGLLKNFAIVRDRYQLQFHAEFFNVLNKTNLNTPVATISSAGFGTITGSADPRIGQLALKLNF